MGTVRQNLENTPFFSILVSERAKHVAVLKKMLWNHPPSDSWSCGRMEVRIHEIRVPFQIFEKLHFPENRLLFAPTIVHSREMTYFLCLQ